MAYANRAAVAGQYGQFWLANPDDSNINVHLHWLDINGLGVFLEVYLWVALYVIINGFASGIDAAGQTSPVDTRLIREMGTRQFIASAKVFDYASPSTPTNGGNGRIFGRWRIPAGTEMHERIPINAVISPGWCLGVQTVNVNTGVGGHFRWSEMEIGG